MLKCFPECRSTHCELTCQVDLVAKQSEWLYVPVVDLPFQLLGDLVVQRNWTGPIEHEIPRRLAPTRGNCGTFTDIHGTAVDAVVHMSAQYTTTYEGGQPLGFVQR
jgi:hypothetical protein